MGAVQCNRPSFRDSTRSRVMGFRTSIAAQHSALRPNGCTRTASCARTRKGRTLNGRPTVIVQNRSFRLCAAPGSSSRPEVATETPLLRVEVPTSEAQRDLRFGLVPERTGQAIVVVAVQPGSTVAEAGIVPGMKLKGISDPVRDGVVWQLEDRPSMIFVRDALRMRMRSSVTLEFQPVTTSEQSDTSDDNTNSNTNSTDGTPSASSSSSGSSKVSAATSSTSNLDALLGVGASGAPGALVSSIDSIEETTNTSSSSGSSSSSSSMTMAEKLAAEYAAAEAAGRQLTAVQQRQERRKAVLEQSKQRDNSGFLLVVLAAFLLPALIILAVAYGTGYIDSLYNHTLSPGSLR